MSDIVERLRGGLSLPWELEAADEIERLRELRDTMLKGEVAIRQRDADEIERLRGLLRNVDDGLDDYWVTTEEGVAWVRARHEALGDE